MRKSKQAKTIFVDVSTTEEVNIEEYDLVSRLDIIADMGRLYQFIEHERLDDALQLILEWIDEPPLSQQSEKGSRMRAWLDSAPPGERMPFWEWEEQRGRAS